jgi:hypothetical protein
MNVLDIDDRDDGNRSANRQPQKMNCLRSGSERRNGAEDFSYRK